MKRFVLIAAIALLTALALLVAACGIGGPTGTGWRDANLHAVDGIWITGEEACGPTSADTRCEAARIVAFEQVKAPGSAALIGLSIAHLPRQWVNERGEQILTNTGGLSTLVVAIVDLAGGERVAVGLMCDPTISGSPARPATCFSLPDVLDDYRVDGPGFNPGG